MCSGVNVLMLQTLGNFPWRRMSLKILSNDGFKKEKLAFIISFGTPSIPAALPFFKAQTAGDISKSVILKQSVLKISGLSDFSMFSTWFLGLESILGLIFSKLWKCSIHSLGAIGLTLWVLSKSVNCLKVLQNSVGLLFSRSDRRATFFVHSDILPALLFVYILFARSEIMRACACHMEMNAAV